MSSPELWLGLAKVDITPRHAIPLAGFSFRKGNFTGVTRNIFARLFLFEQAGERYLLVSADLIWWGPNIAYSLRGSIHKVWGIHASNILLHATHNHSGPQTSNSFLPSLGGYDTEYCEWLEQQILGGVQRVSENMDCVSVEVGRNSWEAGINRRRMVENQCIMKPNPAGPNDSSITVISFVTKNRVSKGMLVHATCHPTTTGDNQVSSEYPGYAVELLEKNSENSSAVVGFLQGYCGDIRPALIQEDSFYRGTDDDVQRLGETLAAKVFQTLQTNMQPVTDVNLRLRQYQVDLPFSMWPILKSPKAEVAQHIDPEIKEEWLGILSANGKDIPGAAQLNSTYFHIGKQIAVLTANAEMVVRYAQLAKETIGDNLLPLGYTNGMIGYVPTSSQLDEGGYEAVESTYCFALPGKFSNTIESAIVNLYRQIHKEWSCYERP